MIRWATRAGLTVLLVLSCALTLSGAIQILRNPLISPMVDASVDEIIAASDRMMATDATPERVAQRLTELLDETPRNWLAIQAVEGVATERAIPLPPDLITRRTALWDEDGSYIALAGECASCVWDAGTCSLTNALVCNAPVTLSPIGDLVGLGQAGVAWATDGDVDEIDLSLSIIGLGATATILASGGTSLTLKLGSGTLKLARKMRLISPGLTQLLTDTARFGIDWQRVTRMDFSDPARLVRPEVVAPLANIASDLGRVGRALPATESLHLIRYIDDATDARHLANATEALGPKTLGRIEILGKSRFMRTTVRVSNLGAQTLAGIVGLFAGIATLLVGAGKGLALRLSRRLARKST
jgi:hypothetical protein